MNDNTFSLEEIDNKQVIIKINADDPLTVAKHPYLSSDMAYITVTRGEDHVLTVIRKNGSTFSFEFGRSGYTLITGDLEELKKAVLEFIRQNHIILDADGKIPYETTICYNDNFDKWQLSMYAIGGFFYVTSDTATDIDSAIRDFEPYVTAEKWEKGIAQTGIEHWTAENPSYKYL